MSTKKEELLDYLESSTTWMDDQSVKRKSKSSTWKSTYCWLLKHVAYQIHIDWRDLIIENSIIKLLNGKLPKDIDKYKHPMRKNIQVLAYDDVINCGKQEARHIKKFYIEHRTKNLTKDDFKYLLDLELKLLQKCVPFLNENYEMVFK